MSGEKASDFLCLDALWMEAPHVELCKIRTECCARLALRDPFSERDADAGACLDSEGVETRGNPANIQRTRQGVIREE